MKPEGSVSTAYSKKNDETTKSNRKRLKPGENPRPRPKDHQMIQGSAKEAQEIVPEGTKLISLIFTNDFDFFCFLLIVIYI